MASIIWLIGMRCMPGHTVRCGDVDADCRPPQHKHFNDNDVAENLVMSLNDSRGQDGHSPGHAHRPNQSTDLSSISSVCRALFNDYTQTEW